jgi:hypothetical protein
MLNQSEPPVATQPATGETPTQSTTANTQPPDATPDVAPTHADTPPVVTPPAETAADTTASIDELQQQLNDLQAALKAANKESAGRRHRIAELETQIDPTQQAAQQAQLAALTSQVEASQQLLDSLLSQRLTELNVPSYVQAAISDRPAADQLAYLVEHANAFARPTVPNVNGAAQNGSGAPAMSDAQRKALAASLGVDPKYLPQ